MQASNSSRRSLTRPAKLAMKRLFVDDVGRWSELYYALFASVQAVVTRRIVERNAKNAADIIDIGSRRSPYTNRLKSHVVYLDLPSDTHGEFGFTTKLSETMARIPNREVVYGSVLDIPFGKNSFDMALCIEVIEHIEEDEKAIGEINRVLKDGGAALFTTPNGDVLANENPHHCRHYTLGVLASLLRSHFSHVEVWSECPWLAWVKSLTRLQWRLEHDKRLWDMVNYSVQRGVYLARRRLVRASRAGPGCMLLARAVK